MQASLRASVVFCALAAAQIASAQDRSPIGAGAEVYQTHCAACHGERLVNTGSTFDLRRLRADERPLLVAQLERAARQQVVDVALDGVEAAAEVVVVVGG